MYRCRATNTTLAVLLESGIDDYWHDVDRRRQCEIVRQLRVFVLRG